MGIIYTHFSNRVNTYNFNKSENIFLLAVLDLFVNDTSLYQSINELFVYLIIHLYEIQNNQ